MTYDDVLVRLEAVTGTTPKGSNGTRHSRCPAHDDRDPSLTVSNGTDGRTLVHCHAGCTADAITAALGLKVGDLFEKEPPKAEKSTVVARYPYADEDGTVLFEAVRFQPKGFRQRRPDGNGGWVWNLNGTRRVVYRLPQVIDAIGNGEDILIVEGEKDVASVEAQGYTATCNPMGAGKWLPEFNDTFKGANVIVVADADDKGRAHAAEVVRNLTGIASDIRCAEPKTGKDVTEHLAAGLAIEDLELIEDAWAGTPPVTEPVTGDESEPDTILDESLFPVELAEILDGTMTQPVPELLFRDDGNALFYAGAVNGIHGDSGTGKGWVICHLITQNALQGKRTLLIDLEDTAASIIARLLALGMTVDQILTWLIYIRPQVEFGPAAVTHFCHLACTRNVATIVIDSLGEAFALHSIDENKDSEAGPWLRNVARPLADTGAAVILVDHSTKAADNPLHPSGSKRKRAAITGASYLLEALKPFVKGGEGRLRLTCAKDRHGTYRRGEAVGNLVMLSGSTTVNLHLYAPTASVEPDTGVTTLLAARAAVAAAKAEGLPLSQNSLTGLMKIKASATVKRGGIDYAVSKGSLRDDKHGQSHRYSYVDDLPEEGE